MSTGINTTKITEKMIIDAVGKDIVLNGLDFTKNGYLEIKNANSVVVKNCRVYKMNCESSPKNYWLKVIGSIPVQLTVMNCFFGDSTGTKGNMYNLIEMDATLKSESSFSNNWFTANCCTHNTINIYGAQEGATIYSNGNHFADGYHSIRVGIKGTPKCKLVANDNTLQFTSTEPDYLKWATMITVQPYGKLTASFENLTISASGNKLSYDKTPILGYFGNSDTPMSRESMPVIESTDIDHKIPILCSHKCIAVIGTTPYDTLSAAIEAAADKTITLVNSSEEVIDLGTTSAKIVAARPGLTVNGQPVEF